MKLHDTALEIPFEAQIDGFFPYKDRARCTTLIAEARAISLNATFCILDEICRLPRRGMRVTRKRQHELLREWSSGFEHELKEPLLVCAAALIERAPLPYQCAVNVMEKVSHFDAQRAALWVAYFSGDCDTPEGSDALEDAAQRIINAWELRSI